MFDFGWSELSSSASWLMFIGPSKLPECYARSGNG
jgi:hypothetical protein